VLVVFKTDLSVDLTVLSWKLGEVITTNQWIKSEKRLLAYQTFKYITHSHSLSQTHSHSQSPPWKMDKYFIPYNYSVRKLTLVWLKVNCYHNVHVLVNTTMQLRCFLHLIDSQAWKTCFDHPKYFDWQFRIFSKHSAICIL